MKLLRNSKFELYFMENKNKKPSGLVKKIATGLGCALVIGGLSVIPIYLCFKALIADENKKHEDKLKIRSLAVGIYNQLEGISDISGLEDYDDNGKPDFYVLFKDGKIKRYYDVSIKGNHQRVEDVSDEYYWWNGPVHIRQKNRRNKMKTWKKFISNSEAGLIALGLVVVVSGGFIYAITRGHDKFLEEKQKFRAQEIGIYNQINDIKHISQPIDDNNDGFFDYAVKFNDGKTLIYHHRGFEKGTKDISDRVNWSYDHHLWLED